MWNKTLSSLISLGFLFGITSNSIAVEMPAHRAEQVSQFHKIEQPLELKLAVTLSGLGLIGLELWWFLGSQIPTSKTTERSQP